MRKIIHVIILILIGLVTMGSDCPNPFTLKDEFVLWTVYPVDGAVIHESNVILRWEYSKYTSVILNNFDVGFGTHPDSVLPQWGPILSRPSTVCTLTTLEPSTTYYWEVYSDYSKGGYRRSKHSEQVSFTTADTFFVPGQLHAPTPDSGAIGVSVNPYLAWENYNPDLIPYDYDLYLGTTTDPPLDTSGLSVQWHNLMSDTLEFATLYYWRMEAVYNGDTITGPLWEFTTDYPSEVNILALFEVDARQTPTGYHLMEEIRARLDTGATIDTPMEPLQADSVLVENVRLLWNAPDQNYSYTDFSIPIIENGQPSSIDIYGNSDVPDMHTTFIFPSCAISILTPGSFETVSINGFEVTWDSSGCGGMIWITLMNGNDSTEVWKEVENDGLDSLTATDLLPLGGQTGTYNLIIIRQAEENIVAPGYKAESLIRMRAYNVMEQINIY